MFFLATNDFRGPFVLVSGKDDDERLYLEYIAESTWVDLKNVKVRSTRIN